MMWGVAIAALVLGLSAAHKRERDQAAQVGGDPRTQAALRRLPPRMRAKAEANLRRRAQGGTRGTYPAGPSQALAGGRAPMDSTKLPWLADAVDAVTFEKLDAGERDCARLTQAVLREVYPVTPDGRRIPWPARPNDGVALRLLEERVRLRCRRHLATLEDMHADDFYG